jgi:hypothetical protein
MAKALCPPFDPQAYRGGHLTLVYFGRAPKNQPPLQGNPRAELSASICLSAEPSLSIEYD